MKLATNRTADSVGQRGHVGTEDNFVGIAVEEIGHGAAGFGNHGVGVAAGRVGAGSIGIVAAEIAGDGINQTLRDWGAAGTIEKHGRMAIYGLGRRRRRRTDPG